MILREEGGDALTYSGSVLEAHIRTVIRAVSMIAFPFTLRTMHLPKLKENPYGLSQLARSLEILVQQFGNFALS